MIDYKNYTPLDEFQRLDKTKLQDWEQFYASYGTQEKGEFFEDGIRKGRRFSQELLQHVFLYNDHEMLGYFWNFIIGYLNLDDTWSRKADSIYSPTCSDNLEQTVEDIIEAYKAFPEEKREEIYNATPTYLQECIDLLWPAKSRGGQIKWVRYTNIKNDLDLLRSTPVKDRPLLIGAMKSGFGERLLLRSFQKLDVPFLASPQPSLS